MNHNIFANEIVNVVMLAYNSGLMQFNNELKVFGITFSLKITSSNFNVLSANNGSNYASINIYDNDSEYAQESSIMTLIESL